MVDGVAAARETGDWKAAQGTGDEAGQRTVLERAVVWWFSRWEEYGAAGGAGGGLVGVGKYADQSGRVDPAPMHGEALDAAD
jgi:hypothetical protein